MVSAVHVAPALDDARSAWHGIDHFSFLSNLTFTPALEFGILAALVAGAILWTITSAESRRTTMHRVEGGEEATILLVVPDGDPDPSTSHRPDQDTLTRHPGDESVDLPTHVEIDEVGMAVRHGDSALGESTHHVTC